MTGSTRRRRLPKYVAVHEAAHAVGLCTTVAARGGVPFVRMFVRTPAEVAAGPYVDRLGIPHHCLAMIEGGRRGDAMYLRRAGIKLVGSGADDRLLATLVEANAAVDLAAPIAEARFRRRSLAAILAGGGRADLECVRAPVWCLSPCEPDEPKLWRQIEARARALVRAEWRVIMTVAEVLYERGSLTGEEVQAMVATAGRNVPCGEAGGRAA